jgi:tetratricopeptide (TPR) repeat protein
VIKIFGTRRAVALELETWPGSRVPFAAARVVGGGADLPPARAAEPVDFRTQGLWKLIPVLRRLSLDDGVGPEAQLRLGYAYFRLGRAQLAIEELTGAEAISRDPFVQFLSRYLRGQILERVGDSTGAVAAYRAALDVVADAQSAGLALAALLFASDQRSEAQSVLRTAVRPTRGIDPWRLYQAGDYRRWNTLITEVRSRVH